LVRLEYQEQNSECDCERGKLIRELRAKLSAWPCPESNNYAAGPPCHLCDGTSNVFGGLPLEWDCGYPRWVTLPTIESAMWVEMFDYPDANGNVFQRPSWLPTPRLRALAATSPWGVPLDGVRAGDREPCWSSDRPGMWYWVKDNPASLCSLPGPVFDAVDGEYARRKFEFKYHPTEQAAADAFARGLVRFAREYEG
jgi:hypothetical protein